MLYFGHKTEGSSRLKIFTENNVKDCQQGKKFKKHENAPTGTYKKSKKTHTRFTDEYRGKEVPINKAIQDIKEVLRELEKLLLPLQTS